MRDENGAMRDERNVNAETQSEARGLVASGGSPSSPAIAYVVAQYPAVNHTYILREVATLRALGLDVRVASVRRPDRPLEKLSEEERAEAERTFYVKPQAAASLFAPHLKTLFRHPSRYLKGLAYTLRLCAGQPQKAAHKLMYFTEALILYGWMERNSLGHAHSHFASNVCLLARTAFPLTMSLTIHGPEEFEDPKGFRLSEKLGKSLFVAAISNYARSQLMRVAPYEEWQKIEVSPLGVDPEVFAPRRFREQPAPFEVICVGRLAPVKAHHILIGAIDRLVREGREVRLRIVGDGTTRAGLEEDARRRALDSQVVFEGALNQDRVRELYARADAFALASFAEGVPVVLMEAMAMEIPCVATCINGVPELIRDRVDGLLVAPSDEEALARALASLMDDADLRRRLGEAGRRRVVEHYHLARNSARLAEIFRRRVPGMSHALPADAQSAAGAQTATDAQAAGDSQTTADAQAAASVQAADGVQAAADAQAVSEERAALPSSNEPPNLDGRRTLAPASPLHATTAADPRSQADPTFLA